MQSLSEALPPDEEVSADEVAWLTGLDLESVPGSGTGVEAAGNRAGIKYDSLAAYLQDNLPQESPSPCQENMGATEPSQTLPPQTKALARPLQAKFDAVADSSSIGDNPCKQHGPAKIHKGITLHAPSQASAAAKCKAELMKRFLDLRSPVTITSEIIMLSVACVIVYASYLCFGIGLRSKLEAKQAARTAACQFCTLAQMSVIYVSVHVSKCTPIYIIYLYMRV